MSNKSTRCILNIAGVRVDNFSQNEWKGEILKILDMPPGRKFITTPNPEILLKAHRDEEYKKILNDADLSICDGVGIQLVAFLRGKRLKNRFTGADLVDFLLETASKKGLNVLVIAVKNSLSTPAEIEQAIRGKCPDLSAKSEYFGGSQNFFKNAIIKEAEIVFVNFGAPEQEKFILENRAKFPKAKILVGVGGAFDFLTGRFRRAPKIWRDTGLEWLWRLLQEPKRIRRICRAVIVFPFLALTRK